MENGANGGTKPAGGPPATVLPEKVASFLPDSAVAAAAAAGAAKAKAQVGAGQTACSAPDVLHKGALCRRQPCSLP